jgi:hypothetical protein
VDVPVHSTEENQPMSAFSHLEAIELRLSHERARVAAARNTNEREWREHNVRMIEREREQEVTFLASKGIKLPTLDDILSDDELLKELKL